MVGTISLYDAHEERHHTTYIGATPEYGIDTPELPDPLDRKARDFVTQVADSVPFVVLTTTKPDKYDGYLSNVFYLPGKPDPEVVCKSGIYLNRELLDDGLAERFTG